MLTDISFAPALDNYIQSEQFSNIPDEEKPFAVDAFREDFITRNQISDDVSLKNINEQATKGYDQYRNHFNIPRYTPPAEVVPDLYGGLTINPKASTDDKVKQIESWRDNAIKQSSQRVPTLKEDVIHDVEARANEMISHVRAKDNYKVGGILDAISDKSKRAIEAAVKPFYDLADYKESQRFFANNLIENPEWNESIFSDFASGIGQLATQSLIAAGLTASGAPEAVPYAFGLLYGSQYMNEAYQQEMKRSGNKERAADAAVNSLPAAALDTFSDAFLFHGLGKGTDFARKFTKASTEAEKRALIKEAIPSVKKEVVEQFLSEGLIGGAGADFASNLGNYYATGDEKYLKNAQDITALARSAFVEGTLGGVFGAGHAALKKGEARDDVSKTLEQLSIQQAKATDILAALKEKDFNKVISLVNGKTMSTEMLDTIRQMDSDTPIKDAAKDRIEQVPEERKNEVNNRPYVRELDRVIEKLKENPEQNSAKLQELTKAREVFYDKNGIPVAFEPKTEFSSSDNDILFQPESEPSKQTKEFFDVTLEDDSVLKNENVVYVQADPKKFTVNLNLINVIKGGVTLQTSPNGRKVKIKGQSRIYDAQQNPKEGLIPIIVRDGKIKVLSPVKSFKALETDQERADRNPPPNPEDLKQDKSSNNKITFDDLNSFPTDPNEGQWDAMTGKADPTSVKLLKSKNFKPGDQVLFFTQGKSYSGVITSDYMIQTNDGSKWGSTAILSKSKGYIEKSNEKKTQQAAQEVQKEEVVTETIDQSRVDKVAQKLSEKTGKTITPPVVKKPHSRVKKTEKVVEQEAPKETQKEQVSQEAPQNIEQATKKADENPQWTLASLHASAEYQRDVLRNNPTEEQRKSALDKLNNVIQQIKELEGQIKESTPDSKQLYFDHLYKLLNKGQLRSGNIEDYIKRGFLSEEDLKQFAESKGFQFEDLDSFIKNWRAYESGKKQQLENNLTEKEKKLRQETKENQQRRVDQTNRLKELADDVGLSPDKLTIVNSHADIKDVEVGAEDQGFVKMSDGHVYMILDNIMPFEGETAIEAAERVFKHEVVGHLKISQVLSGISPEGFNNLVQFLKGLEHKGKNVWERKTKQYNTQDERIIVDEIFAEFAENRKKKEYRTLIQKILDWIRINFLKAGSKSDWMVEDMERIVQMAFNEPLKGSDNTILFSKNFQSIHLDSSLRGMYGAWITPNGQIDEVSYQDHFGYALEQIGEENATSVDQVYNELYRRGYIRAVNTPDGVFLEGYKLSLAQRAVADFIGINDEKNVNFNGRSLYQKPSDIRFSKQPATETQPDELDYLLDDNNINTQAKSQASKQYAKLLKQKLEQKLIIKEKNVWNAFNDVQYAYLDEPTLKNLLADLDNFVSTRTNQEEPSTQRTSVDELMNRLTDYKNKADLAEYEYWKNKLPDLGTFESFENDIEAVRAFVKEALDKGEDIGINFNDRDINYVEAIDELQLDVLNRADDEGDIINRLFAESNNFTPTGNSHLDGLTELIQEKMRNNKALYAEYILFLSTIDSSQLSRVERRQVYYSLLSIATDGYPNRVNSFISADITNLIKNAEVEFRNPYTTRKGELVSKLESNPTQIERLAGNSLAYKALIQLQSPLREGLALAKRAHEEFITPYIEAQLKKYFDGVLDKDRGNMIGMFMHLRQRFLTEKPEKALKSAAQWILDSNRNLDIYDKDYKNQGERLNNYLENIFFDGIDLDIKDGKIQREFTPDDVTTFQFNSEKALGKNGIEFADSLVKLFDTLKPLAKFTTEFIYGRTFEEIENFVPSMSVIVKGEGFEVDISQYQLLTDNKSIRDGKVGFSGINTTGSSTTKDRSRSVGTNRTLVLNPEYLADSVGRLAVYDYFTAHQRQEMSRLLNYGTKQGKMFAEFLGDKAQNKGRMKAFRDAINSMWQNEMSQASYLHPWHVMINWAARKRAQSVLSGVYQLPAQSLSNTIPYFVQHINEPKKIGNYIKALSFWIKYKSGSLNQQQTKLIDRLLFEVSKGRQQDVTLDKSINLGVNPNNLVEQFKKKLPFVYRAISLSDKTIERALMFPFKLSDAMSGSPMMLAEYLNNEQERIGRNIGFEDITYNSNSYIASLDAVERYIGIGDNSRRGEYLTNRNAGISIIRNLLVAFRSFSINNAVNFSMEAKKLVDSHVDTESKIKSLKYMAGILSQSLVFNGVKISIQLAVASAIISAIKNPDDEERLKKLYRQSGKQMTKEQRKMLDDEISMHREIQKALGKLTERNTNKRIIFFSTLKDATSNMAVLLNLDFIPNAIIHFIPDAIAAQEFKQHKETELDRLKILLKKNQSLNNKNTVASIKEQMANLEMQEFMPVVFENRTIAGIGGSFGGTVEGILDAAESSTKFLKAESMTAQDFLNLTAMMGISQPDLMRYIKTLTKVEKAKTKKDE